MTEGYVCMFVTLHSGAACFWCESALCEEAQLAL